MEKWMIIGLKEKGLKQGGEKREKKRKKRKGEQRRLSILVLFDF